MNTELDKKVLLYWELTAAVLFAAVFSALLIGLRDGKLKGLLCISCAAVFAVVAFIYLPLLFKNTGVTVQSDRVSCRKGVIIKREYIYPNPRLIYIETVRLPIASCFGLRLLVLRGSGNSLLLPPMTAAQAARFERSVNRSE